MEQTLFFDDFLLARDFNKKINISTKDEVSNGKWYLQQYKIKNRKKAQCCTRTSHYNYERWLRGARLGCMHAN